MNKYAPYAFKTNSLEVFKDGNFIVYRSDILGRYFLVLNGSEVAFKNVGDTSPNFTKWVATWIKNAEKQLVSLQARMAEMQQTQNEIEYLLNRS